MSERKLSQDQKREVIAHLINETMDVSQIATEYNLSARQVRYYQNFSGAKGKVGPDPKKKEEQLEVAEKDLETEIKTETEESTEDPVADQVQETENVEAEVQLREEDLDPDKFWCGTCFSQNVKTENFFGQQKCQICGADLVWS